jgi:hypothetical protein
VKIIRRTVPAIMEAYGCSADTARIYMDMREEGYSRYEALLMAGLADPHDPDAIKKQPTKDAANASGTK